MSEFDENGNYILPLTEAQKLVLKIVGKGLSDKALFHELKSDVFFPLPLAASFTDCLDLLSNYEKVLLQVRPKYIEGPKDKLRVGGKYAFIYNSPMTRYALVYLAELRGKSFDGLIKELLLVGSQRISRTSELELLNKFEIDPTNSNVSILVIGIKTFVLDPQYQQH